MEINMRGQLKFNPNFRKYLCKYPGCKEKRDPKLAYKFLGPIRKHIRDRHHYDYVKKTPNRPKNKDYKPGTKFYNPEKMSVDEV